MKKILTSLVLVCILAGSVQAQYYYKPYTFLQRHTDHPGFNPGNLNADLESAYSASLPNGWALIDPGTPAGKRWTVAQAMPFAFSVNGTAVTHYKVSTTGVLTFDTATALAVPQPLNLAIPSALIPDNSLMVWGLVDSATNDKIITKTFGTAPNQQHWVMFNNYSISGKATTCYSYWAIVMEETTNKVYFMDMRNGTTSACNPTLTVGIQVNSSTAYSVTGSPNVGDFAGKTPLSSDNQFYEFIPGTQPAADVMLYNLAIETFKTPPASLTLSGKIVNHGANTINSFDFKYDLGGTVYTRTLSSLSIAPNATYTFTHTDPVNVSAAGRYGIKAWAVVAGDANPMNDSARTATHGLSYSPAKRVLFEEGTGTWCGWCPRGTVFMDSLRAIYPNTATLIAVHNGDPMTVATYDAGMGYEIGGYPSGLADRKNMDIDPSSFFSAYNQRIQDKAPCDVDVQTSYDPSTRVVTAIVHAHFATEMQGDYRFNAVVVEDDVTGTASTYAQANYYNGSATIMVGAGHNWNTEPDPIPAADMEYDHVGRALLGGWDGTVNSLPVTIPDGSDQYYTYTYTVPATQDPSAMHVIGWVTDPVTGNIYNSARSLGAGVGLHVPVSENFDVRIYPNPASTACNIKVNLVKSAKVSVELLDVTGRLVYSNLGKNLAQGEFIYPLNTSQLADGLYTARITVGEEQISQRIVIQQ